MTPVSVRARRCKGCGAHPITCATGDFAGYWHLHCLKRARLKRKAKS